jgi:hypothetical protein
MIRAIPMLLEKRSSSGKVAGAVAVAVAGQITHEYSEAFFNLCNLGSCFKQANQRPHAVAYQAIVIY